MASARRAACRYFSLDFSAGPEMISGVRASSIRMESTSSMTQKLKSRSTRSSALCRQPTSQPWAPHLEETAEVHKLAMGSARHFSLKMGACMVPRPAKFTKLQIVN